MFGPDARAPLESRASGGRIATLSWDALRYAQRLPIETDWDLANRIYFYNRLPLTPQWRHLLSPEGAHARYLGVAGGGVAARALARHWSAHSPSHDWLAWSGRFSRPIRKGPTYKLYVSPATEALAGEGFTEVVLALTSARAAQFKVGAGATGLLRPDKLVAYFCDFEALAEGVSAVRKRLAGMPAHGVPFTAEIARDGLLSWGADPPLSKLPSAPAESWRLWLARRLAGAIIAGRTAREPWRCALDRLRIEGVDTDTWTPSLSKVTEA